MLSPKITAIVCTRNRAARLETCIRSLREQTLARDAYEILVVDNASTDETPLRCADHAKEPGFRWVRESAVGLSQARNTGWRQARGQFVGYIDDDAEAEAQWIEAALGCLETVSPTPSWVGGPIDLSWDAEPPSWLTDIMFGPLGKVDWGSEPKFVTADCHLGGGNSFFPRTVLENIGGFDTRLGRQGENLLSGEETQLAWRLAERGGTLFYHPAIRIRHHVDGPRLNPVWFYRRYYWGGYTDVVMNRTLGRTQNNRAAPDQSGLEGNRLRVGQTRRLLTNLLQSTGFCVSAKSRIMARSYMAYVAGWSVGYVTISRRMRAAQDAESRSHE
jgi:glycosyltransferase involved in cell wall biosynthesis